MTRIMKEKPNVDTWNEYEAKSYNWFPWEQRLREIHRANLNIAQRLHMIKPVININKLERDYQHSRYLQMLWAENARDYDVVVPRHEKYRALRSEDGSVTDRSVNTSQLDIDVKALFKVAKQLAQPEDVLVKHLVKRTHGHRMQLKTKFKETYELDLVTELKSGLGSEWEVLIDALLKDRNVSSARALHDALEEGDYPTAVEMLYSHKNRELTQLKESYRKEYGESLENGISDKTEEPERNLLVAMAVQKGNKDESSKLDERLAQIDADDLFESGDGRWSDESGKFIKMLQTRNFRHIRTVLNLYKVTSGGSEVSTDIKRECTKNYAEALLTLITCLQGGETHYADKLFNSMAATDPTFVNTLVARSDVDMPAVRKAYKKKYDADLADDIRHKCSHQTTTVLIELALRTPSGATKKSTTQSKYATPSIVPPQSKSPVKRPNQAAGSTQSKSYKGNPLAQPSQRVAADAAAVRKDEMKNKEKEQEAKREQERQQKNVSGTIKPANNFNPTTDCERLKESMKGFGTDESTITDILPARSNGQRQILRKKYTEMYKKDLLSELKSELAGDFEEVILGLMLPPAEYDAYCLHEAIDGIGTTESTLIGIICTRDAKNKIKLIFILIFSGDTSGDFTDLLIALLKGERAQGSQVNKDQAVKDAKALHKNGQLAIDTKDEVFINILVKKNHAQVKATFVEYEKLVGHDIYKGLSNAMLGDAEDGYISLAKAIEDPVNFFAERLESCFNGLGTNDNMLIRILVTRSEVDLGDIKARYKELYGKTLSDQVKKECGGNYKQLLLAILGEE
ncbi:hypothetical protein FSP39_007905 [Pinctada imbricata]|uniref:Annexin n=1 Tax=Pinctada imbricata TaxID=66713 RepID=A0AA88XUP3_PINIB|nr:hypothetical protein FSP39_007905 [Pinctada imbricata]